MCIRFKVKVHKYLLSHSTQNVHKIESKMTFFILVLLMLETSDACPQTTENFRKNKTFFLEGSMNIF